MTTTYMDSVVKLAEECYRHLHSSQDNQDCDGRGRGTEEIGIPPVNIEEANKALEGLKMCKTAGKDHVTADLLKEGG